MLVNQKPCAKHEPVFVETVGVMREGIAIYKVCICVDFSVKLKISLPGPGKRQGYREIKVRKCFYCHGNIDLNVKKTFFSGSFIAQNTMCPFPKKRARLFGLLLY